MVLQGAINNVVVTNESNDEKKKKKSGPPLKNGSWTSMKRFDHLVVFLYKPMVQILNLVIIERSALYNLSLPI